MASTPPYLHKGDTIGIVSPAGYMPFEKMMKCVDVLQSWGYQVQLGATTHSNSDNYFSGTDDERQHDLQTMLDDKNIKAILCARGGYGISRIIDKIDFKKFVKKPKWLIGFSDVTVLHAHVYANYNMATIHSSMASAFNNEEESEAVLSLKNVLEGGEVEYNIKSSPYNNWGTAEGELVGGNLALLSHLIATPSDINTKNKILFIEDVGEYLYNIDRMILQLKRCGKLKKLAGLVIGGFTDCKDTERPFGKGVYEIIHHHIKDYDYPVCYYFPVSHGNDNVALKVGVHTKLTINEGGVTLQQD